MRRLLFLLVSILGLAGCAHFENHTNTQSNYVYGLDAKDRAPASMSPPTTEVVDTATTDPLTIHSQADYHFAKGEAYALEGAHQKAIENYKLALVYDPNASTIYLRLATEYLRAGLVSEAVASAESVVDKDPKSIEGHLLLGGLYSSMRLFPKAIEQYQTVIQLAPTNNEAPLYLGAVYSEVKQPQKAVQTFEKLIANKNYKTPEVAYYYIGRIYSDQPGKANHAKSEAAYKKAISLKPNYADAVLSLAAIKIDDKSDKEVLTMLETFQKKYGPNGKVADTLAQIYIKKEMFDEAYAQYEILESLTTDNLDAKMRMALILIEKQMYEPAIGKLKEILAMAPDSDRVRFYLGAIYEERKNMKDAIEQYKQVPTASQYYPEAVLHVGFLTHQLGDLNGAVAFLSKVLENDQCESSQVVALYASLLDEKGESDKALGILEKSAQKYPESYQIKFYLGALYDKTGQKDKSVAEMRKVLDLNPNHAQAMNYLAFTLVEMNKDLDEAEKLASKAVKLEPKDGYILDTMGWVLFKRGHSNDAIKYLEAAYGLQPDVSVIAEHLGDLYSSMAMTDKAAGMYEKAIEMEKDQAKIAEIKIKLGQITHQKVEERSPASVRVDGDKQ